VQALFEAQMAAETEKAAFLRREADARIASESRIA
jgi:hypothetical protein